MMKRYPATLLATCCIPWNDNDEFEEEVFRRQVRAFLKRGVRHLYLFGTAGEGYAVTDAQYDHIVTAFAEEMQGPDCRPMVGQLHLSLHVMLERMQRAYDRGIRDFAVVLPSWGALSDRELDRFFDLLCGAFPDVRLLHYNLLRAKRLLGPEDYVRMADRYPALAGVKFTTRDAGVIHELVTTPCPIQFFLGETGFALGRMFGECGLLTSVANTHLRRAWQLVEAGEARDFSRLIQFVDEFRGLAKGLSRIAGAGKIDGAYDKLLFRMVDPKFPLHMLPPYEASTDEQADRYRTFLAEQYPQWLESARDAGA